MSTLPTPETTNSVSGPRPADPAATHEVSRANVRQLCTGFVLSSVLRLLSASWRARIRGAEILDELAIARRPHILVFWHQHYVTLFKLLQNRPIVVVTNQSPRGQVIANICSRNRMQTLKVADRGNKATFGAIDRATANGDGLGIAVDGPLGPARKVKRAVPHLASRLGCCVVPISVVASHKFVFMKRWDKLEIPYFFSRVSFEVGEPMCFPKKSDASTSRDRAKQIERALLH